MGRQRFTPEQIIAKLREVDVNVDRSYRGLSFGEALVINIIRNTGAAGED